MYHFAVLGCLLVASYAQPPIPVRPVLPETFTSTFSVFEMQDGQEMRGSGRWDRSETLESTVITHIFKTTNKPEDFTEHLGLFATHKMYSLYTGPDGRRVCNQQNLPETAGFPSTWQWLRDAKYHQFQDHRANRTYDAWSLHEDMMERTLLIFEGEPNKPAALLEKKRGVEEDRRFMSFEATNPPASAFTVPPECMPTPS